MNVYNISLYLGYVGSTLNVNGSVHADATRFGNNANLCGNGTTCGSDQKKINGSLLAAIMIPTVSVIALFVISIFLLCRILKEKGNTVRGSHPLGFFFVHCCLLILFPYVCS